MQPDLFRDSPSGRAVRTPAGFWAFVPNPLPPPFPWTPALVAALSEADRALGELAGLGRALPNPHLLIRPFVRREAVLSSRIEGTQASLTQMAELGLLREITGQARNRVYRAEEVLHAIEESLEA